MRVIPGIARSMPLKAAEGDNTRPLPEYKSRNLHPAISDCNILNNVSLILSVVGLTTDRIKETLFNMLQSDIAGCRFLDLYSGSGAIGIEALSRGAKKLFL